MKIRALTITELLIATILISIVMLGVIAITLATRQVQTATSLSNLLVMQTNSMMIHVSKNIALATGNRDDDGIVGNLCIRQDIDINGNPIAPPTPTSFGDDTWRCYRLIATELYTCRLATSGNCTAANELLGNAVGFTSSFVNNPATGDLYVEVTITTRANPAQPSDPINNPEHSLSSRVAPSNYSG